jgi:hypothetical protein
MIAPHIIKNDINAGEIPNIDGNQIRAKVNIAIPSNMNPKLAIKKTPFFFVGRKLFRTFCAETTIMLETAKIADPPTRDKKERSAIVKPILGTGINELWLK